ncbi:MAG: c-type cytochrome [Saprospiraceae bacterium]|nr:c-type cytochrome [Saprospiraceae bacterium]
MTKSISILSIVLIPVFSFAQETASAGYSLYSNLGYYLLGGAVLLVAIAAVVTLMKLLDIVVGTKEVEIYGKHVVEEFVQTKESEEPFWSKLYKQATKVVPVTREKEILLDHNYDGIRELDNRLPPWWVAMFYITIVWGVLYFGYHHLSGYGQSSEEAYLEEISMAQASVDQFLAGRADVVDENSVKLLADEQSIADGKFIYQLNCVVCHLESGAGLVGPNLTDEYWIHGGGIKDVFKTIKYGVPEKGMIAWSSQLRPVDMQKVASYILSMQGSNPENPKAPEGEKYTAEGSQ